MVVALPTEAVTKVLRVELILAAKFVAYSDLFVPICTLSAPPEKPVCCARCPVRKVPPRALFPAEPEVVIDKLTTESLTEDANPKPPVMAAAIDVFISLAKAAGVVIELIPTTVAEVVAEAAPPEKDCADMPEDAELETDCIDTSPAAAVDDEKEVLFELSAVPGRRAIKEIVPLSQSSLTAIKLALKTGLLFAAAIRLSRVCLLLVELTKKSSPARKVIASEWRVVITKESPDVAPENPVTLMPEEFSVIVVFPAVPLTTCFTCTTLLEMLVVKASMLDSAVLMFVAVAVFEVPFLKTRFSPSRKGDEAASA
jgi:hypothetical protein